MATPAFNFLNQDPDFARINPNLNNNFDDFAEGLWDHFFENYYNNVYTVVKHKDVVSSDVKFADENYYVTVFREQIQEAAAVMNEFQTELSAAANPSREMLRILLIPSDGELDRISAAVKQADSSSLDDLSDLGKSTLSSLSVWDAYLQHDTQFKRKSLNVMVFIFELMKTILEEFEDMILTKSTRLEVHSRSIEIASNIIADRDPDLITDTHIKDIVERFSGKASFQIPSKPDDLVVQLHNNEAGAFRDTIKGHREIAQKRMTLTATESSGVNSSMVQQTDLLKSFVSLHATLVRRVISKR